VIKLEYNSKAATKTIKDFKDILMQGYYKKGEFRYILEADTKIVIELIVGIKILLDMAFITL